MKTAEEWIDEPRDNRCYKAMSMRNYLSTHESEHDDDEITCYRSIYYSLSFHCSV